MLQLDCGFVQLGPAGAFEQKVTLSGSISVYQLNPLELRSLKPLLLTFAHSGYVPVVHSAHKPDRLAKIELISHQFSLAFEFDLVRNLKVVDRFD
jgi:hypothetical protein